eukprot:6667483-Prymnesium_polylepis.1
MPRAPSCAWTGPWTLFEKACAPGMWASGLCRMSREWVPSITVALVGPYASMPDDVRLSDRVFC